MSATLSISDDSALLASIRTGDESALKTLMQKHQGTLYHFLLRYTCDETLARESVHDTFVRVWFKAPTYQPKSTAAVKTWLFTIALNIVRDNARRRRRKAFIISLFGNAETNGPVDVIRDESTDIPDADYEKQEQLALLQNAILKLSEKLRLPLVMCALEGMEQREAALILHTSPKAIELRIRRAKEKLRAQLVNA